MFLLSEVVLYGFVHSIQYVQPYGFGMEIEVIFGMDFEADFSFLFAIFGLYEAFRTVDCGHGKQGRKGQTAVRFWHGKQGRFLWDSFGAVRYFPWLEM
jgi:hypothetical protein